MYCPKLTNAEGKTLIDCILKAKYPTTDNISDRTDEESRRYDALIEKIQQSGDDTTMKNFIATVHIIKNNRHRDIGVAVFANNMQRAIKIVERLFGVDEVADEVTITAMQEFAITPGCLILTDDNTMPRLFADDENEKGLYTS